MFTKLMLTWLLIETHFISATEHMFNPAQVAPDNAHMARQRCPTLVACGDSRIPRQSMPVFFFSLQRPGLEGFSPVGRVADEPGKHTFNPPRRYSYSYNNVQNGAFCISLNELCFRKMRLTFSAGCLKYYLRPEP